MTDYTKLIAALRCDFGECPDECIYNIPEKDCEAPECPYNYKIQGKNLDADAAAAIEALQAEMEELKRVNMELFDDLPKYGDKILHWVSVEDELPDDGEWAIFTNGKVVTVERFKLDAYNHFFPTSQWFDFEDAIAWMPLPEPPKEEA